MLMNKEITAGLIKSVIKEFMEILRTWKWKMWTRE